MIGCVSRATLTSRAAMGCLASALLFGGCGSTEREGEVGDTHSSQDLRVTVVKVDRKAPRKVCKDPGQAVRAYDFELETGSGERTRPKLPQSVYPDDFDVVREDCERGWIVFEVPTDSTLEQVHFTFDDTGSARSGDKENHARFSWSLASVR